MSPKKGLEGHTFVSLNFCDTLYEGIRKIFFLMRLRWGGGDSENIQICVTSLMDDPLKMVEGYYDISKQILFSFYFGEHLGCGYFWE